jgi:hypothetical protein
LLVALSKVIQVAGDRSDEGMLAIPYRQQWGIQKLFLYTPLDTDSANLDFSPMTRFTTDRWRPLWTTPQTMPSIHSGFLCPTDLTQSSAEGPSRISSRYELTCPAYPTGKEAEQSSRDERTCEEASSVRMFSGGHSVAVQTQDVNEADIPHKRAVLCLCWHRLSFKRQRYSATS